MPGSSFITHTDTFSLLHHHTDIMTTTTAATCFIGLLPTSIIFTILSKFLTKEINYDFVIVGDFYPDNYIVESKDWKHLMNTNKLLFAEFHRKTRFISLNSYFSKEFIRNKPYAEYVMNLVDSPDKQINLKFKSILEIGTDETSSSSLSSSSPSILSNVCSIQIPYEEFSAQCEKQLFLKYFKCSKRFPSFHQICKINSLSIDVDGTIDLSKIEDVINLSIGGYENDVGLIHYSHLTSLKYAEIYNCYTIDDISCWEKLVSLTVENCSKLKNIPFQNIESLVINNCPLLENKFLDDDEDDDENDDNDDGNDTDENDDDNDDNNINNSSSSATPFFQNFVKLTELTLSCVIMNQLIPLVNLVKLKIVLPFDRNYSSFSTSFDTKMSNFFGNQFPSLPFLQEITFENFCYDCNSIAFQNIPNLLYLNIINCYAHVNVTGLVNLIGFAFLPKQSSGNRISLVGLQDLSAMTVFKVYSVVMTEQVMNDYLQSFQSNLNRSVTLSIRNHTLCESFSIDVVPFTLDRKDQFAFLQVLDLHLISNITEVIVPTSVINFHGSFLYDLQKIVFPRLSTTHDDEDGASNDGNVFHQPSTHQYDRIVRKCVIENCGKLQLIRVSRKISSMIIARPVQYFSSSFFGQKKDEDENQSNPIVDCLEDEGGKILNLQFK